jgi:NhaP-type Na+/H+ or K+/H+ antiporter
MLLLFLALFFVVEAWFEKNKPRVGHTTGVIVLFGMLVSYLIYVAEQKSEEGEVLMEDLQFNEKIFFDLALPLIIYPSGFNMRRKKFFRNIKTIMKFGFIGTMFCFSIYTAMVYGC